MSFDLFDFDSSMVNEILHDDISSRQKLRALSELLGETKLPSYLINYIESYLPSDDESIVILPPHSIDNYEESESIDKKSITRTKGFMGQVNRLREENYPNALHFIRIFYNSEMKARIFYKYVGNVKFLKTSRKDKE